MSGWIAKKAEDIKQRERSGDEQRRWALHKAGTVASRSHPYWTAVLDAARKDVETFNASFPDDQDKHIGFEVNGDRSFQAIRGGLPTFVIDVSLGQTGIYCRVVKSRSDTFERDTRTISLTFDLAPDGQFGVVHHGRIQDPAGASEAILGFLF